VLEELHSYHGVFWVNDGFRNRHVKASKRMNFAVQGTRLVQEIVAAPDVASIEQEEGFLISNFFARLFWKLRNMGFGKLRNVLSAVTES
jgi:hypothetical protein